MTAQKHSQSDPPPYGALAPSAFQESARRAARLLPRSYLGRKAASLLLWPAGGRAGRAFDVGVFGSEAARLHPYDNICEKRVFLTPHHWDPVERRILRDRIANHRDGAFFFVDVGANAGLYTLFARSAARAAGAPFRAVCVEPEPEMLRRLAFNIAASGAQAEIAVVAAAATAADGPVRLDVSTQSRGMNKVSADGSLHADGRTLTRIARDAGLQRIDALKIDIEGHEETVLSAFFNEADRSLWPRMILMEISHMGDSAAQLVVERGYEQSFRNDLNAIFVSSSA